MSDPQESITVATRREGATAVIELAGELDLHSSGELGVAIDQVLADAPEGIDIDAQGLSFADSAGLRALLLARKQPDALLLGLLAGRDIGADGDVLIGFSALVEKRDDRRVDPVEVAVLGAIPQLAVPHAAVGDGVP